jgi:hypothetical protein
MTFSEGPAGVVLVAAELVAGAAEFGVGAVLGTLAGGGMYRFVGGAIRVVGALVVVVNGGAGAGVVGLALGGAGGAGAGADVGVAGAGCSGADWLAPPTRTAVATMTINATTRATPINVRPRSVLNHFVVPGFGSVSVINKSASLAHPGIVRRPPDGRDLRRRRDEALMATVTARRPSAFIQAGRRREPSSRERRHDRHADLVIAAAIN